MLTGDAVPHEFTSIKFPVKAVKILLHDIQSHGESATLGVRSQGAKDVESDDEVTLRICAPILR